MRFYTKDRNYSHGLFCSHLLMCCVVDRCGVAAHPSSGPVDQPALPLLRAGTAAVRAATVPAAVPRLPWHGRRHRPQNVQ